MEAALIIEIGRKAIITVLLVAGPMLLAGLFIGLAVGIFQAVTQIHEMTLTFIPKIVVIIGTLFLMMPWIIRQLIDFTLRIFGYISQVAG
ncbi:MAG: flagellar biosynthesis protein FliQ [Chitinivibrionales bacterium]